MRTSASEGGGGARHRRVGDAHLACDGAAGDVAGGTDQAQCAASMGALARECVHGDPRQRGHGGCRCPRALCAVAADRGQLANTHRVIVVCRDVGVPVPRTPRPADGAAEREAASVSVGWRAARPVDSPPGPSAGDCAPDTDGYAGGGGRRRSASVPDAARTRHPSRRDGRFSTARTRSGPFRSARSRDAAPPCGCGPA